MRIGRLLAVLFTAALLVVSCGNSQESSSAGQEATPAQGSAAAAQAAPGEIPEQLNFSAKTVGGDDISGAQLAGQPTVMWFWAPWCSTCKREAPTVAKAAQQNPDVQFVGVAALDEVPAMQDFIDTYKIGDFPNIADTNGAVWQRFGVTNQPAFAFIGADGSVDVVVSSLGSEALETRISTLVGT